MSYSRERDVSFQGGDADVCVGEEASNFEIETLFIGGRRPQATLLPPRVTTVSAPTPEVRGPPPPPHPASYGPDATYEVHPQGSSQGPRSPAHAPQFKYGIVAAVAGRAHLREKTESIKSLLQAYRIEDGEWFGQVGFRLDAGEKKNGVDLDPLNQEIAITIPKTQFVSGRRDALIRELRGQSSRFTVLSSLPIPRNSGIWNLTDSRHQQVHRSTAFSLTGAAGLMKPLS
jgi:hypothetical protein